MAARREDKSHLRQLEAIRAERFALMEQLARLPDDTVFFTQITMEAAEDEEFLRAMKTAHIRGALVGVESVTAEGLKSIYKNFNESGEHLVERLQAFRNQGVHVLGSFIFGLPGDRPDSFDATLKVAEQSGITFAQFVMLTPFPGTLDFAAWEKSLGDNPDRIGGIPLTRHWLIPQALRPKIYMDHPVYVARADPQPDTRRLGPLLQSPEHLEARNGVLRVVQSPVRLPADIQAVPSDVRQHGHRHRQRARQSLRAVGAMDGAPVPSSLRRAAYARPATSLMPRRGATPQRFALGDTHRARAWRNHVIGVELP